MTNLQRFGDLRVGDTIYRIRDGKLLSEWVTSVCETEHAFTINTASLNVRVPASERTSDDGTIFTLRSDAVHAYKARISRTIQDMCNELIRFTAE